MPNPSCPFAKQRPLARAASKPKIHPTASAAHTAVTSAGGQQLGDFFEHQRADSHFYVDRDGTLWQYQPVDVKSWAQYRGNDHAVSYETWDGGNPSTPWNPAQMDSIVRLLVWLNRDWGISLEVASSCTGPGAAWHSKFAEWNTDNHQCPGATRVGQLVQEVLPAARKRVFPPTPTPEEPVNRTTVSATPDGVKVTFKGLDQQDHPVNFTNVVGLIPIAKTEVWSHSTSLVDDQAVVHADPAAPVIVSFT